MVKVRQNMKKEGKTLQVDDIGTSLGLSNGASSTDETIAIAKVMAKVPYPKSVFFIVVAECAERFSFYGMRTILSIYIKELLRNRYNHEPESAEHWATIIFHCFTMLAFFIPLFGAYLADSCIGKYRTIVYLSIVYIIGHIFGTLGAIPCYYLGIKGATELPFALIGLTLVAIGTGGIKPCVVSFGADQFTLPQQSDEMDSYFGIFYFCINVGAAFSIITTPFLRKFECFGERTCYSLAFAVPGIVMIIAFVSFLLGTRLYHRKAPKQRVIADFFSCVWIGIKSKFCSSTTLPQGSQWLDAATPKFGKEFVSDVRAVLSASFLFLLYPPFWALFDQQASKWTFQASLMNGLLFEGFQILPDQMTMANSFLVLILIPIFDRILYPALGKFGILKTPLQKIVTGGIFVSLSFFVAASLESKIQENTRAPLLSGQSRLSLVNTLPCDFDIIVTRLDDQHAENISLHLSANETASFDLGPSFDGRQIFQPLVPGTEYLVTVTLNSSAPNCDINFYQSTKHVTTLLDDKESTTLFLYASHNCKDILDSDHSRSFDLGIVVSENNDALAKSSHGYPMVRLIYVFPEVQPGSNEKLVLTDVHNKKVFYDFRINGTKGDGKPEELVHIGKVHLFHERDNVARGKPAELFLDTGGSYNIFVSSSPRSKNDSEELDIVLDILTPSNTVHMFWQIPQYVLLTMGEIMFSITGLAFAFTQAPTSMKAFLIALYKMTNACGNLLDIFIMMAISPYIPNRMFEFLLFGFILLFTMLILALVSTEYVYKEFEQSNKIKQDGGKNRK